MLFQTTAAHEELRSKIRNFAEEEIKPLAFLMDCLLYTSRCV